MKTTQAAANRLADGTRRRVAALWARHEAGQISRSQFRTAAAAAVATANAAGVQLADIGLAAEITRQLRRPTAPLGLRASRLQVDQARMGSDIDRITSRNPAPADELGAWARSEPLLTVATAVQNGMHARGIERWTRGLSGGSCPLCVRWADGVARPTTVRMVRHPGCDCIQQPVMGSQPPTTPAPRGDMTPESAARELVKRATEAEKDLTRTVTGLADRFGGEAVGLDFRLKTEESLTRKIAGDVAAGEGTAAQVASKMFDVNRYTIRYADDTYAASVQSTIDALRAEGNQLTVKNYWTNAKNPYQGVNVQVTSRTGTQWELQFHTPTSLDVKEGEMHKIYEASRVETDPVKIAEYDRQSHEVSAKIPVPPGIGDVS